MHEEIKRKMRLMVDEARVPHAILFTENSGNGAIDIALDFVKYLFCTDKKGGEPCGKCNNCSMVDHLAHPDLHFAFPTNATGGQSKKKSVEEYYPQWRELVKSNRFFGEKELNDALGIDNKSGTISVSDAAEIMRELSLSSYGGGAKVMLVMFPEKMNTEAANKLLKSLEEPRPDTCFILISHSPQKILKTVLSRCLRIEVPPIDAAEVTDILVNIFKADKEEAAIAAKRSCGSVGKALDILGEMHNEATDECIFMNIMRSCCSNSLYDTLLEGERLAAAGRENIKAELINGLEITRKLLMLDLGLDEISFVSAAESAELTKFKGILNKSSLYRLRDYIESSIRLIERNVNAKFVIADLCNRIYFTCREK